MKKLLSTALVSCTLLCFSSAALAAAPIKIGALFAVTGPASFLGEPERNSAQMVVDEINGAGGVKGHRLELITYDTGGDATKAV
jgi:branched-chain amino acid transport system substrate-binding protein